MSVEDILQKIADSAKTDEDSMKEQVEVNVGDLKKEVPNKDAFHNTEGVWEGFKDNHGRLLDRILDQRGPSAKADKALFTENFNHSAGEWDTMSPMLTDKVGSLMERVVKITGRK